jgi:AraC family transcriptional regulator
MEPRLEFLPEKKFVGKKIRMSFTNNKTRELWQSFMPCRKNIKNIIGNELYSAEVYESHYFENFNPEKEFEKWAAVEVSDVEVMPDDLEILVSHEGIYAVFIHQGPASAGPKTYQYIFGTWLPGSEYSIDDRPHFAIMGDKYKHEDPASEEEIWIPVKKKD